MAKQDKLERVPPILPILWQDWDSDPDIMGMSLPEEGFYFKFLKRQWVLGDLPADPWKLAKELKVNYRTTAHWLQKYSYLTVQTQRPCSEHAPAVQLECTKCAASLHNKKLKNLRIDVISDLALGTTEPKITKPKVTEPEHIAGVEDEAPTQAPAPEPEAPTPDSEISKFLLAIAGLLGKTTVKRSVLTKWEAALQPKVKAHSEAYVLGLLKYALEENEVWARAFSSLTKQEPVEYFATKFETIEGNREGDEKFKKIRDRKHPAKTTNPEHKYEGVLKKEDILDI